MDVFQPLVDFYERATEDGRMGPTHISVYMALLYQWHLAGGSNPVVVSRKAVMRAAKIHARHTYHRCMRELHGYGYIRYLPSCHPCAGSRVYIKAL